MESQFGIHFKSVLGLEGNIRYQAIASDKVDVTDAYSTDAMTVKVALVPLKDDLGFFPPYQDINLVRKDLFSKSPEIKPVLEQLHHHQGNGADELRRGYWRQKGRRRGPRFSEEQGAYFINSP